MSDFKKLNGYYVKDETARNNINELDTRVTQNELDIENLQSDIHDINSSTLLNVTEELPEIKNDNTLYEVIKNENEINIENLPISPYELSYNATLETEQNKLENTFKIGTFNIENENNPYRLQIEGLEKQNKLKYIFDKMGCSILGLNETINGYLYPASELYTTDFYKYAYFGSNMTLLTNLYYGNTITSYFEAQSSTSAKYTHQGTTNEPNGYTKAVYVINNKLISFYSTHFYYADPSVAQQQINELYDVVSADTNTYKIIVGDFNIDLENNSEQYLSSFLNAGYKQVNHGQYKTHYSNGFAIDEILVSSNIDINDSGMLSVSDIESISDHLPIWAEITLS